MKALLPIILVCTYLIPTPLLAQTVPDTIHFRLTEHNNILIESVLNERDTLDLMFHTAVSSVSLTAEAIEKMDSLRIDGNSAVNSWGGRFEAGYSEHNRLAIGAFKWDSVTVWANERSGHHSDGKFGPSLFFGKVIELNFDERIMVIHGNLPDVPGAFRKAEVTFDGPSMMVRGECFLGEEWLTQHFLVHSGYSGGLLFDDAFSNEHQLGEKVDIISEQTLKDSYGATIKTKQAILPSLRLAGQEIHAVTIGFFEGKIGRQQKSVLGAAVLTQFNLFIDLKDEQLFLAPNGLAKLASKQD